MKNTFADVLKEIIRSSIVLKITFYLKLSNHTKWICFREFQQDEIFPARTMNINKTQIKKGFSDLRDTFSLKYVQIKCIDKNDKSACFIFWTL